MRKVLLGTLAVLLCVGSAQAAISFSITQNAAPAPGLDSYTVTVLQDDGIRPIAVMSDLNITGTHNVDANSGPVTQAEDWVDGLLMDATWAKYDTHLLLDDTQIASTFGSAITETNDGSDPAGLNLFKLAAATEGVGSFGNPVGGTQDSLLILNGGFSLDLLQVVVPAGTTALMDIGIVYGEDSIKEEFVDVPIVPEPATMSLLVLGGVALLRRRR